MAMLTTAILTIGHLPRHALDARHRAMQVVEHLQLPQQQYGLHIHIHIHVHVHVHVHVRVHVHVSTCTFMRGLQLPRRRTA